MAFIDDIKAQQKKFKSLPISNEKLQLAIQKVKDYITTLTDDPYNYSVHSVTFNYVSIDDGEGNCVECDPCANLPGGSQEECECQGRYWYADDCHDEPDPCEENWEDFGYASYEDCTCQSYGYNCSEAVVQIVGDDQDWSRA